MEQFEGLRYYFEHRLLPNWFYEKTEVLIERLEEGGEHFLYGGMSVLCEESGAVMKYTREQYKIYRCNIEKEYTMIRIEMPRPEGEPMCYEVYLVFSDDYQSKKYFTVEMGSSVQERFLCSWDQNQSHCNYGVVYEDTDRTERKIADIFEASF